MNDQTRRLLIALYDECTAIGRIADAKEKYAQELTERVEKAKEELAKAEEMYAISSGKLADVLKALAVVREQQQAQDDK